jgi:hypothetical protein
MSETTRCPRCAGAGLLRVAEPECNGGRIYGPCDRCRGMGTTRWNLSPGGDNADGPRASDGAITGIDGPDPDWEMSDGR